jgi:hypothetical protein
VITSVADVARALRALAAARGEDVRPGATDAELAGVVARVAALGAQVPAEHLVLDVVPARVLARHVTYADLLGRAVDAQA